MLGWIIYVLLDAWVCLRAVTLLFTVPTLDGTLAVRVSGLGWGQNGVKVNYSKQGNDARSCHIPCAWIPRLLARRCLGTVMCTSLSPLSLFLSHHLLSTAYTQPMNFFCVALFEPRN